MICSNVSSNKCSGCGFARYCSVEHQRRDWARHKAECRALQRRAGIFGDVCSNPSCAHNHGVAPLQQVIDAAKLSTKSGLSDAQFTMMALFVNEAVRDAAINGQLSALTAFAHSDVFRFITHEASSPRRSLDAAFAASIMLPVVFKLDDFRAEDLARTSALQPCISVCVRVLNDAPLDKAHSALFALWYLGPVSEVIDIFALDILPRIIAAASVYAGLPFVANSLWNSRHQARTLLKDLMVGRKLESVNQADLRSLFTSRADFRSAVQRIVSAGGLRVFCDALSEDAEVVDLDDGYACKMAAGDDDVIVIALMAFAVCDEPAWFDQIACAAAASRWGYRAQRLYYALDLEVPQ